MSRRTAAVLAACVVLAMAVVALVVVPSDGGSGSDARPTTTTTSAASPGPEESGSSGSPGAAGVGDPYFPGLGNGGYDVEHYDLDLTWLADEGRLEGVATIEATATQDLSRFNLDLSGMDVRSLTVDGSEAPAEHVDRELVVTPTATISENAGFVVEVAYGGRPQPIDEGTELFGVGWQTDGREAYVISEPAGAATFFPVNDHPTDKATYTFDITAPADQVVAANGLLVGEPREGEATRTWTYEATDPMASYLVQVVIGDYLLEDAGEAAGVPLRHVVHRSFADQAREALARTGEMMEMLVELLGPYPFEAYGVVAVDEPLGFALETQTLTIIGSDVGTQGRGADLLLLHELAHQWLGNSVTVGSWKDIWLNEGFTTYAEWLWLERTGEAPAADTARAIARRAGSGLGVPPGDPGSQELFQSTVYLRGGMALQALREAIGDDDFFELLRTWVAENSGTSASTADLVALSERISGQELDDLFDEWLYADALPGF